MKRITIVLPDELARAAERAAYRRRVSLSEIVREALRAHLEARADGPRPLPFVSLRNSGYRTTARDLEDLLDAEWSRDRDR